MPHATVQYIVFGFTTTTLPCTRVTQTHTQPHALYCEARESQAAVPKNPHVQSIRITASHYTRRMRALGRAWNDGRGSWWRGSMECQVIWLYNRINVNSNLKSVNIYFFLAAELPAFRQYIFAYLVSITIQSSRNFKEGIALKTRLLVFNYIIKLGTVSRA